MTDFFGKDTSVLRKKKLWLFDLDGTIYSENKLFPGVLLLLEQIEKDGGKYIFITNNSSKSVADYIDKVNKLGIAADETSFFTSTQASALFIKEKYPNALVYCQGTHSFVKELHDNGIKVTVDIDERIGLVLVGFDTELTSEKLYKTCLLLSKGIPFYATNCDLRCPVDFGFIPDCGSICGMLTNSTGRVPVFIGKPEPTMVYMAMNKNGFSKEQTVVVGDRLYTDIASGKKAGITSICVLSGEATIGEIKEGEITPDFTFESVKDIFFSLRPWYSCMNSCLEYIG